MQIPLLDGRTPGAVARRVYDESRNDDILSYAAALAFHAVLALFPFLAFLFGILSYLDITSVVTPLLDWANHTLPPSGVQRIRDVIDHFQSGGAPGVLSVGMVGAIWAASGGVRSAMRVLNRAYDVEDPRSTVRRFAVSTVYTIGLASLVVMAGVLLAVGPELVSSAASTIGLTDVWVEAWRWLRYPVAIGLLVVVSAAFYSLLPNVDGVRFVSAGSVVAVTLWVVVSLLFRLYTTRMGHYSAVYGSIGAVIVLLLYAWLSSIILLIGAEVNGVLRGRGDGGGDYPRSTGFSKQRQP